MKKKKKRKNPLNKSTAWDRHRVANVSVQATIDVYFREHVCLNSPVIRFGQLASPHSSQWQIKRNKKWWKRKRREKIP